jgi:LAGLIDADG DNA endonuclease family
MISLFSVFFDYEHQGIIYLCSFVGLFYFLLFLFLLFYFVIYIVLLILLTIFFGFFFPCLVLRNSNKSNDEILPTTSEYNPLNVEKSYTNLDVGENNPLYGKPVTEKNAQYKLSRKERAAVTLPQNLINILVGLILGDLTMQKFTKNGSPNLQFEQGLVHKEYIFHLYDLFKDYCKTEPKITERKPDTHSGKVYTRVRFNTRCLPCFKDLYSLFYPEGKKNYTIKDR